MEKNINMKSEKSNFVGDIICKTLGCSNESHVLIQINNLNNYMIKHSINYFESPEKDKEIDLVLACSIMDDYSVTENKNMFNELYRLFLVEVAHFVSLEQFEEAITRYREMILILINHYNIIEFSVNNFPKIVSKGKVKLA